MKLYLIIKFFLTSNYGQFRKSFIFPFLGILIGSYSIFVTFSIMNGLEDTIMSKINSFHYKYYINNQDSSKCIIENNSMENIVLLKNKNSNEISKIIYYYDLNKYKNKIKIFLNNKKEKIINVNDILIGSDLADKMNIITGDTVQLFFPSKINLGTNYIPHKFVVINDIFKFDFLDYDDNYIIASFNIMSGSIKHDGKIKNLTDIESDYSKLNNQKDLLINALTLEKKIYTSLGYLVILISGIMMFNIMFMVIIDKKKQIFYLNLIGLTDRKIIKITAFKNLFISFIISLIGYFLSELTFLLNYKYGLFSIIFNSLPFKISNMNIEFSQFVILFITINVLILVSSIVPLKFKNRI